MNYYIVHDDKHPSDSDWVFCFKSDKTIQEVLAEDQIKSCAMPNMATSRCWVVDVDTAEGRFILDQFAKRYERKMWSTDPKDVFRCARRAWTWCDFYQGKLSAPEWLSDHAKEIKLGA